MSEQDTQVATYANNVVIDDDHGCVRVRLGDGERFIVNVMSVEEARGFAEAIDDASERADDWVENSELGRCGLGPEDLTPAEKPS